MANVPSARATRKVDGVIVDPATPLLVGECNPYGGDPCMALYPLPAHASGGRRQRLLGLSVHAYLAAFERRNLCEGEWDARRAELRADAYEATFETIVALGSKVAGAFDLPFKPFETVRRGSTTFVVLPHPSGRCRLWNDPSARPRARATLRAAGIDLHPLAVVVS